MKLCEVILCKVDSKTTKTSTQRHTTQQVHTITQAVGGIRHSIELNITQT